MRILCMCVLAACVGVASARATVLVPADLGELSREAIAIARGRVAAVDAQWTDDHRTIETIVTLEVESYLKGSLGSTLQFRVPGGAARPLSQHRRRRAGVRRRSARRRVSRRARTERAVRPRTEPGRVSRRAERRRQRLDRHTARADAARPAPSLVVRGDAARRPMALADFEQRVRALAGGCEMIAGRRPGIAADRSSPC